MIIRHEGCMQDWYCDHVQLLQWWLQGERMTDLGTDILGNAELVMLVPNFILHLKIVVPLLQVE